PVRCRSWLKSGAAAPSLPVFHQRGAGELSCRGQSHQSADPGKVASTTGHRVLDQIVNVIERNLIDWLLYFERAGRRIWLYRHNRRLDRRALLLDTGNLLDQDGDLFAKIEVLAHPIPDLLERVRGDFNIAAERIGLRRRVP